MDPFGIGGSVAGGDIPQRKPHGFPTADTVICCSCTVSSCARCPSISILLLLFLLLDYDHVKTITLKRGTKRLIQASCGVLAAISLYFDRDG